MFKQKVFSHEIALVAARAAVEFAAVRSGARFAPLGRRFAATQNRPNDSRRRFAGRLAIAAPFVVAAMAAVLMARVVAAARRRRVERRRFVPNNEAAARSNRSPPRRANRIRQKRREKRRFRPSATCSSPQTAERGKKPTGRRHAAPFEASAPALRRFAAHSRRKWWATAAAAMAASFRHRSDGDRWPLVAGVAAIAAALRPNIGGERAQMPQRLSSAERKLKTPSIH